MMKPRMKPMMNLIMLVPQFKKDGVDFVSIEVDTILVLQDEVTYVLTDMELDVLHVGGQIS